MASHRSQKLKVYGGAEVDKLDNGRYRVTIRCEHDNNTEGWFEKYREDTFPEFDTLASAGFGTDPASAYDGQYYADQRLISASLKYLPQKTTPVVEFVYETLTSTWTNEVQDVESSTENGLRTLERVQVARPGTAAPYDEDDVGVSTITSGGKTLYLAGFQDASTDRVGRFVSRWAEAGTLRTSYRNELEGLKTTTTTFLAVEGATTGVIVAKSTDSFNGLKTISVTTVTKSDGTAFTIGEEVETYGTYAPFTYPGIAQCKFQSTGASRGVYYLDLDPPVQAEVEATVSVSYQTTTTIGTLPYTYWNPKKWAKFTAFWLTNNLEPTSRVEGLRGYRTGASDSQTYSGGLTRVAFLGRFVYAVTGFFATMSLSGGPEDPVGNTYVIDRPKVTPAFVAEDGTKWYRRTVVYATIPSQT